MSEGQDPTWHQRSCSNSSLFLHLVDLLSVLSFQRFTETPPVLSAETAPLGCFWSLLSLPRPAASSWGGGCKTHDPTEPCRRKSSSGGGRFGAGLIGLQWECGSSRGPARLEVVGPQNSSGSPGAGPRWLLQHAEAGPIYQRSEGCHFHPLERARGLIS